MLLFNLLNYYELFVRCVTAVFIDQDEGVGEYVKDSSMGDWAELPDLVLEKILSYLPLSERYHCSLVCKRYAVC